MAEPSMFNSYDVATAQNQNANTNAMNVAQLPAGRATVYGAGVAGNMLSSGVNKALGRVTPQQQKAEIVSGIMKKYVNADPTNPQNILMMARDFADNNLPGLANKFMSQYQTAMSVKPDKPATKIQLFNEAVKGGYPGDFFQYQIDLKAAGAPSTTMLPTPAKGFQYEQDENGNWVAKIIPGGSADLEKQEVDKAKIQSQINKQNDASVVLNNVSLVRDAIKNPATFFGIEVGATGWGSLLKDIPASQAKGVEGMIKTMKGNIGFAKLQAMREASPTGGALGQVSNIELELLTGVIGSLDQAQSDEDLLRVLDQIESTYNMIVHGQATAPKTTETTETGETELNNSDDPLGVL